MKGERGTNVENALLDAVPVENVLGPAIPASWDHTEHVFHAEGDSGPVMRFHLGHGHKKISLHHRLRQPEPLHSAVAAPEIHRNQLVAVQIYESDSIVPKNRRVTPLREHHLCGALMPRSFRHDYLFGSKSAKALRGGRDEDFIG